MLHNVAYNNGDLGYQSRPILSLVIIMLKVLILFVVKCISPKLDQFRFLPVVSLDQ
jgi:hypothetical protein